MEANNLFKYQTILLVLSLLFIYSLSFAQNTARKWETEATVGIGCDPSSFKVDNYDLSVGEYYTALPYLWIGGGVGVDAFKYAQHGHDTLWDLNCFGDLRFVPLKRHLGPEFGIMGGALEDLNCKEPGWFVDPYLGLGYRRFSFRIQYKMTRIRTQEPYWTSDEFGSGLYEKPDRDPDGYFYAMLGNNVLSFSIAVRF